MLSLFIEVLLEGRELILTTDATSPPGIDETETVTHELGEGGADGEDSDLQTVVLHGSVDADDATVEDEGQKTEEADGLTDALLDRVTVIAGMSDASEEEEQEEEYTDGEDHGKKVYDFQTLGIFLVEIDAGDATVVYLTVELPEVRTSLVPYPCLGEEAAAIAGFEDADGEVDILTEAHAREATEFLIDIPADAHVERTGIELVELLLAATDTSRGEEGRHGVGDGFLRVGERAVGTVGTTESVSRLTAQFIVDSLEIAFRQYDIGVEDQEIVTLCPFSAIVACLSGA